MTFQDWAREYYDSAEKITAKLEKLQAQRKAATDAALIRELNRRIGILCSMRRDCLDTAAELMKRKGIVK